MSYGYFDEKTARRIGQATLWAERSQKGSAPVGKEAIISSQGFWAIITEADRSTGRYSWESVKRQDIGASKILDTETDWPKGSKDNTEASETEEAFATEVSGSKSVLTGSIVWMMPGVDQRYYLFAYAPGIVRGKASGVITARSTSPGTGEVLIERLENGSYVTGDTVPVVNDFSSEIADGVIVQLGFGDGVWAVTGADCED